MIWVYHNDWLHIHASRGKGEELGDENEQRKKDTNAHLCRYKSVCSERAKPLSQQNHEVESHGKCR
jgi:hypothetical protein